MRHRLPALAVCILALSILAQPVFAQRGRPERIGSKPNLNGIWQAVNTAH